MCEEKQQFSRVNKDVRDERTRKKLFKFGGGFMGTGDGMDIRFGLLELFKRTACKIPLQSINKRKRPLIVIVTISLLSPSDRTLLLTGGIIRFAFKSHPCV